MKNLDIHSRNSSGAALIELLVALVIASLLALALCASIGTYMRLTTTTEGRELAVIMAEEALERVKSLPFDCAALDIPSQNGHFYAAAAVGL